MKHKSRLTGVLVVLCVAVAMASPAFAQLLTLEAKDAGGNVKTQFAKGDDLYLHINLTNAGGVAGCAFTLNFPADVLAPPSTNSEGLSSDITSAFPFMQSGTPTHRENSAEDGKIYFAGAEIAPDGGAVYDSGPVTLFTVKFKVKTDAPAGAFSPTLTQTELFNPAAGYGTDANANGIFDAGDTKGKVPVLVGALANTDTNFGGDLSDDFPVILGDQAGAIASLPLEIPPVPPHEVKDELVLNYGAAYGLWHYAQATGWVQLNPVAPSQMQTADIDNDGVEEVVAGFTGYGLYVYKQGIGWTQINSVIPDAMVRFNNGVVCDYGTAYGLWYYSVAGGWVQFNSVDPDKIVAVDLDNDDQEELVISFAGYGLYTYKPGVGWNQINTVIPDDMIRQGNGIAADYGAAYGLWYWDATVGWVQRTNVDPGQMRAVDIDNDGLEELVVSFGGYGLYYYDETTGWQQLNTVIPDDMMCGNLSN